MSTPAFDFRQLQGTLPQPTRHPRWRQARAVGGHRHAEGAALKHGDTEGKGGREDPGGSMQGKALRALAQGGAPRARACAARGGSEGPRPYLLPGPRRQERGGERAGIAKGRLCSCAARTNESLCQG